MSGVALEIKLDLRALAREALADKGADTTAQQVDLVLSRIPAALYEEALRLTLGDYIREVNRRSTPAATVQATADAAREPGGHASRRVAAIGQAWAQMLARRIPTVTGTQVILADANAEQVMFYAGLLNVQAARTKTAADAYVDLAALMREHKVTRVRDLPPHVGSTVAMKVAA